MKKLLTVFLAVVFCIGVPATTSAELLVLTENSEQVVYDTTSKRYWYRDLSSFTNLSYDAQLVHIDSDLNNNQYFGSSDWHLAEWGEMNTLWNVYSAQEIANAFLPSINDYTWSGRFQAVSYGGEILMGVVLYNAGGWYEKHDLDYHKSRPQTAYPHVGAWIASPAGELCRKKRATIIGTNGDDMIVGTDGDDVIVGLEGNDIIYGLSGKDIVCGGPGDDVIHGGPQRDKLYGDGGNDVLRGQGGSDILKGNGGNDSLNGGNGGDKLNGGAGDDTLYGHGGDDELAGSIGLDVCNGGDDNSGDMADETCECITNVEF